MELRHLRTFLAVVEEGSVTGGAQRLFLSQPAVTRQLQALERSLGGALLERQVGNRLTPAGELLVREARRLLDTADRISEQVVHTHGLDQHRRHLTLGVFLGRLAAAELTDPIITAFRRRYPDVMLNVRTLPLRDPWGRRQKDLDVLIYKGSGAEDDDVSVLFEEPHVASLPSSHRLVETAAGSSTGLSAEDLAPEVIQDATNLYRPSDRAFSDSCDLRGVPELVDVRRFTLQSDVRVDQILAGAVAGAFVNVTVGSVARLTQVSGIERVPIHDVPPATACLAVRRPGPLSTAFRQTALDLTRDLLPLVPEARLSPGVSSLQSCHTRRS
ncbi:MAG: LysR family transcriptional regulator [Dermatophilaceae bacterium]